MDHGMSCVLRARTQMQDRKDLRTGVDGQPQPQDVGVAAQPRPQLVQLAIGKLELTEKRLMQGLSVPARPPTPRAAQGGVWLSTRRESAGGARDGAISWGARLEKTVECGA